ncbi:MAG: hypothetical protein AAF447_25010 [Myxococcota bacterium]
MDGLRCAALVLSGLTLAGCFASRGSGSEAADLGAGDAATAADEGLVAPVDGAAADAAVAPAVAVEVGGFDLETLRYVPLEDGAELVLRRGVTAGGHVDLGLRFPDLAPETLARWGPVRVRVDAYEAESGDLVTFGLSTTRNLNERRLLLSEEGVFVGWAQTYFRWEMRIMGFCEIAARLDGQRVRVEVEAAFPEGPTTQASLIVVPRAEEGGIGVCP